MSFRLITIRFIKHGRFFLQSNWKRDIHSNILEQNQKSRKRFSAPANALRNGTSSNPSKNTNSDSLPRHSKTLTTSGLFRFGQHARKVFIDNILNRVTTAYSEELRQQATKKLFYGDSASFFALVGVSLATGSGIITKEDELESVCWEIREAANRLQNSWNHDISVNLDENFNIDKLDVGPAIAKGCAAVVYAAAIEKKQNETLVKNDTVSNISVAWNNRRYPFALKMMFNYDIQSNALAILRAMYRETIPARQRYLNNFSHQWERLIQGQIATLVPHPNIVCMYGFFCDEVRDFPDGHLLYPIAQPQRINPIGYGRNMSLYLLMKRYDYSLRTFLDTEDLSMRTKLLLLTQLLEAVTHINRHSIAHRDIKTDNILIELNEDSPPLLVLSDFGCCSADKDNGLQVPYNSYDMDKGGNTALMAPEIINKQPGPFSVLDYTKADLWACGAIAYEIFGQRNPFYSSTNGLAALNGEQTFSLCSNTYNENDLPPLPEDCPFIVKELIKNILNPNPSKRVTSETAANVLQLFLWAPSKWFKSGSLPNSSEILQWLLTLTTKVMINNVDNAYWMGLKTNKRRTYVEYLIISSFLARARLCRIRTALDWIQNIA